MASILLVGLLLVPGVGAINTGRSGFSGLAQAVEDASLPSGPPIVNASLALSPTSFGLSPIFWGTTISPRAHLLPEESEFLNSTPTQSIVWPGAGAGDEFDPMANVLYTGGGIPGPAPTSEAQFVVWCKSIGCQAIFQVPGEIDDPTMAAEVVLYTEVNLSFHPAYWEIGNEPNLWHHWGTPWSQWGYGSTSPPTPIEYAEEVANYIPVMRAANARTQFASEPLEIIGIPAAARSVPYTVDDWINETVAINGPNIAAVAFHEYPASGSRIKPLSPINVSLAGFYNSLESSSGLPARIESAEQGVAYWIAQTCPTTCHPIPVFVTELGSALSKKEFGQAFSGGFPGALAMSAEVAQAMTLNVTNADLFAGIFNTTNSWITLQGVVRPEYVAYAQIFSHLGSVVFPTTVTGLNHTVYGIATLDPSQHSRSDLLLVNTNISAAAQLRPQLPGYAPGSPVEVWYWNGTPAQELVDGLNVTTTNSITPSPVPAFYPDGLPSNWTLPPQSLVLFEAYPQPTAPVRWVETGLPSGAYWFIHAQGGTQMDATNATATTVLAPIGEMTTSVPPVYLPVDSNVSRSRERLQPFYPPKIETSAGGSTIPVHFVLQWRLNITSGSPALGQVGPGMQWGNASQPLVVRGYPNVGVVVSHWTTIERLSANETITNVSAQGSALTISPNGSITARAAFEQASPVIVTETGLPSGTDWSVTVHANFTDTETVTTVESGVRVSTVRHVPTEVNTTTGSVLDSFAFDESNGSYGFSVNSVDGYRPIPVGSSFSVSGSPVSIQVRFVPSPRFPIAFVESGLPNGTAWSVSLPNASHGAPLTITSVTSDLVVPAEEPGMYGYIAKSGSPEYHALSAADGFSLLGPGLVVPIQFAPVVFPVTWEENGLGPNLSWSVTVGDQVLGSSGAWTVGHLMNGSYEYEIPSVDGFVSDHPSATFSVSGAGVAILVSFTQAAFSVSFSTGGLPAGATWTIRLGNSTLVERSTMVRFSEPNGSYTFNVTAPAGFAANPSHGVLVIQGQAIVIATSLTPTGPGEAPPVWSLAAPALATAVLIALGTWGTLAPARAFRRRRGGAPPAPEDSPKQRPSSG
ncbi:MAG: hypothetical protein WCA77_08485 [Thermoplasmata archaeon]